MIVTANAEIAIVIAINLDWKRGYGGGYGGGGCSLWWY